MKINATNFNSSVNYQQKKSTPNFGMSVLLDKSAHAIIKKQVTELSPKKGESFLKKISELVQNQKENPVNIIIRKANRRKALVAEIVDSPEGANLGAKKNKIFSQGFFFKTGNTKFLKKAENEANNLNAINTKVKDLIESIPEATKDSLKPIKSNKSII